MIMNNNSRTRNTILNLCTGLGGQFIQVLLKFITRTIFIHALGSVYLGVNGLFTDILTLLSISELGFDTAINYKLYKPLAEHDENRLRVIMKFYKTMYIIVGSVIFFVGLCLVPFLRFLIKDYDSLGAIGINATLIFLLYLFQCASTYWFFTYKSAVVRADQKTYILNLAQIAVCVLSNLVQIFVLLLFKDFILYTVVILFFSIFESYVFSVIAQNRYPNLFIKDSNRISKDEIVSTLKDCGALLIYKINGVITRGTGNIILSAFVGLVIVGVYSNYLLIYNTLNTLLNKFYDACKASMGNVFAVSDTSKSYFFFGVMNYLTIILYGTAAVGIAVLANEFIFLWLGDDYLLQQPIPILIGVELLISGIRNNLGQVRNVTGVFRQMWWRPLLGIVINLGIALSLVKPLGVIGILLGIIISNILTNFMVDPIVIHKYSFKNFKPVSDYYIKNIGYIFVLILTYLITYCVCDITFCGNAWITLIAHMLACIIIVPFMLVLVYYKSQPCQYLLNMIRTSIIHRNKNLNV